MIAASRTEQWVRRPHTIWRWLGRSAIAGLAVSVAIALASGIVAPATASAADPVPPSPGVTDSGPPSPGGPVSVPPSPGIPDPAPPISPVAGDVRGPEQTVFDWGSQRCPDYRLPHVTGTDGAIVRDMPDAPTRAYRTAGGQVTLIASGRVTRRMVGPDLDHLRRDCTPVLVSPYLGTDASSYAMRLWMYSPYTPDGTHVYALLHTEYHGDSNLPATPQNCPSGDRLLCWYDAITMAASTDTGSHFGLAPRPPMSTPGPEPPESFVASIPYVYNPNANASVGYFETSNIVARDGYYYALMTAQAYRAQKRGTCLIRTNNLADPRAWRAWDGQGFNVQFIDPYIDPFADPAEHVCEPVSLPQLGVTAQGLVWSAPLKQYIAVDAGTGKDPQGHLVDGVFYSTSPDLIHWSPRQLLWQQQVFNNWQQGDPNPIGYASLIDPTSHSRNFETVGRQPYLYFVRDRWNSGNMSRRDVHRIQVTFTAATPTGR